MASFPNHVQIGINDTPITLALEGGDFKTAERLIEENTEPDYLDEGPYEKIPLALCLSNSSEFRKHPRHLRLAKLLVERGANPNLRIPEEEWREASPSAMECIVELYSSVRDLCAGFGKLPSGDGMLTDTEISDPLETIGLHDETNLSPHELKEQLLELMDIFLGCGGDPNVTTTASNSTLYHLVFAYQYPDKDMILKLHDAGGDMNQCNVHGTTPLMDLVYYGETEHALNILNIVTSKSKTLNLQAQNCANETAFWRTMFGGSTPLSIELLNRGADPDPKATVTMSKRVIPEVCRLKLDGIKNLSALFAPLVQDSITCIRHSSVYIEKMYETFYPPHYFDKYLVDKIVSASISPVVDRGYLNTESIVSELEYLVENETPFPIFNMHSLRRSDIVRLMFGKTSAGLHQMCVRRIMEKVFFEKSFDNLRCFLEKLKSSDVPLHPPKPFPDDLDSRDHRKKFKYIHRNIVHQFSPELFKKLVELLGLPPRFEAYFFVEAAKYQVAALLNQLESVDCVQGCDGDSDDSLTTRSWEDSWSESDGYSDSLYTDDDWPNYAPSSDEVMDSSVDDDNDDDDEEEEEDSDENDNDENMDKGDELCDNQDDEDNISDSNRHSDDKCDSVDDDAPGEEMANASDLESDNQCKNSESMDLSSFCCPDEVEREVYAAFQDDSSSTEITLSDSSGEKSHKDNSE